MVLSFMRLGSFGRAGAAAFLASALFVGAAPAGAAIVFGPDMVAARGAEVKLTVSGMPGELFSATTLGVAWDKGFLTYQRVESPWYVLGPVSGTSTLAGIDLAFGLDPLNPTGTGQDYFQIVFKIRDDAMASPATFSLVALGAGSTFTLLDAADPLNDRLETLANPISATVRLASTPPTSVPIGNTSLLVLTGLAVLAASRRAGARPSGGA